MQGNVIVWVALAALTVSMGREALVIAIGPVLLWLCFEASRALSHDLIVTLAVTP